jgi:hypothetical protein
MIFPSVTSVDGQADKLQDSMDERGAYARRLEKRSTSERKAPCDHLSCHARRGRELVVFVSTPIGCQPDVCVPPDAGDDFGRSYSPC